MPDISKLIVKRGDVFLYKAMLASFDEMSKQFAADGKMNSSKLTIKRSFVSKYDLVEELRKTAPKPSEKISAMQLAIKTEGNAPSADSPLPKQASAPPPVNTPTPDATLDPLMDPNTTPMSNLTKKGDANAKANFTKLTKYLVSLSPEDFKPPLTKAVKIQDTDVHSFPTNAATPEGEFIDPRRSGRIVELAPIGEKIPVADPEAFQWFIMNGPKFGFIVYLNKGLYYIGQEDIKNKVGAVNDDQKQAEFRKILEKFLSEEGTNSLTNMINNKNVDLEKALSDTQAYVLPPPTIEDCKGIDRTIWGGHKVKSNLGLISAEKTDFESLTRAIITIEGGYGAPVNFINLKAPDSAKGTEGWLLPGYEIMAGSGETLWGIDRAAGAWETSGGSKRNELAKNFWGLVDKYSGYGKFAKTAQTTKGRDWPKTAVPNQNPTNPKGSNVWPGCWAHYHVPTDQEESTKMWQALSIMMQNEFETYMNLYFKGFDDLKNNIIYADGRFKFHYYRLLWNGIGFMQKAADHLKQLYKDGERAPLVLQCKNMTYVYNNNVKLIKDSVAAVKTLTGLTEEMIA